MLLLTGVISVLCLTDFLRFVDGNALLKPEHRGMVWTRDAFNSAGYNYMGINCGGIAVSNCQTVFSGLSHRLLISMCTFR